MLPMELDWNGDGFVLKPIVEVPKMFLEDKLAILDRALDKETPESLAIKLGITDNIPDICYQPLEWLDTPDTAQRAIVSAANRFKTKNGYLVVPCVRHYSPEHRILVNTLLEAGIIEQGAVVGGNQGFVDQYSNYWTREQACIIAHHAGQIQIKHGPVDQLFSEDLY